MLLQILWLILLILALTGCDIGSNVEVDTSPVGAGLAAIGIGIVIAAWVRSCFGGGP